MNRSRFFIFSSIVACCVITVQTKSELKLRTKEAELQTLRDFPVDDLDALRKFIISSRPNFPSVSDLRLMQFHHSTHYNITKTKEAITRYYEMFNSYREIFENRRLSDSAVKVANKVISQHVSPKCTHDGGRIILANLMKSDSSEWDSYGVLKYFFMAIEGSTYVNGIAENVEIVIDYSSLSFSHYLKLAFDLDPLKKAVQVYEKALPIRTKAIHIVNANSLISYMIRFAKRHVSQELYKKVKIYKPEDMNEFRNNVPTECLSKAYGGTLGSLDSLEEQTEVMLEVAESSFAEEEKSVHNLQKHTQ